jgi:hypothetical protein
VDEVVISNAGETRLRVEKGRWVLVTKRGSKPIEQAFIALLPLLERPAAEGRAAVDALHGPPFPWDELLLTALGSDMAYWQEKAVPWFGALGLRPSGPLAEAATMVAERKLASQRHRQQLLRWLRGEATDGI